LSTVGALWKEYLRLTNKLVDTRLKVRLDDADDCVYILKSDKVGSAWKKVFEFVESKSKEESKSKNAHHDIVHALTCMNREGNKATEYDNWKDFADDIIEDTKKCRKQFWW
jgi:hypothetical protein